MQTDLTTKAILVKFVQALFGVSSPAIMDPAPNPPNEDPRRERLLDAALQAFLRYGFRKTSMEEVARGAGLSRQALYLHFETKEVLFRAAVRHALELGLRAASEHLGATDARVADRLVGAFDEGVGRYV